MWAGATTGEARCGGEWRARPGHGRPATAETCPAVERPSPGNELLKGDGEETAQINEGDTLSENAESTNREELAVVLDLGMIRF